MVGVWNRSRNQDVLIVRVHKLLPKKVWKVRYDQINRFEEILIENGTTTNFLSTQRRSGSTKLADQN